MVFEAKAQQDLWLTFQNVIAYTHDYKIELGMGAFVPVHTYFYASL